MARVAINGLGRIGRAALKVVMDSPQLELVAVNDIGAIDNMAYLLKYDTVYGPYKKSVEVRDNKLIVDGKEIAYLSEKDPANLPWSKLNVDLVFESTGFFTKQEDASKHITAGAKYVIISGPSSSENVPTIVYGVNTDIQLSSNVISTASCTTNNITPVIEIMGRHFGVAKALMTTVHAYTATQMLVDAPGGKDMRRGRSAAANIVPSSTGAAVATTKALPEHKGNFDGVALRVPVAVGSIADTVMLVKRPVTVEEVNNAFREEAAGRYKDVVRVTEDAIVSSDIIGDTHAAIVSLDLTQVVGGDLVKVMSWYDNEWGYTNQMVRQAVALLETV